MNLDEIKNALCKGKYSCLVINWNDGNGPNYQSVKDLIEEQDQYYGDVEDFIGGVDEMDECKRLNSIWTAHWYPNTPIGFCHFHTSTYAKLHAELERLAKEASK
jgi:hypothetical protein